MEIDLREFLSVNIRNVWFFGYLSKDFDSKIKSFLYAIYSWSFISFWFIAFIISEFVNMFLVFGDMEKMTAGSFLFLTHAIQVTKLVRFKRYEKEIKALINSLNRKQFKPQNEEQRKFLLDRIHTSQLITKVFMVMVVSTCSLWGIFPLLDKGSKHTLPLSGWFPFNTSQSPVFEIVFVYQVVGAAVNGLANISVDTFMSGGIMIVAAQLSLVNQNLEKIGSKNKEEGDNDTIFKNRCDRELKQCVDHHRNILEFSEELTKIFSEIIMAQFVIGVIIICITMFQMTLVSVLSMQFWSMLLYQSCILFEVFLHCYYGNEVLIESRKLTNSAYSSNWIHCPVTFRKDLIFFMTRSQRPLKLYAGGFFTLSLETFVTILRTSWSYFAVLNHVHANK